jgi:hypothetical protein
MNTNSIALIILIMSCILVEISGIYMIKLGKKPMYPTTFEKLGKLFCILSPILLIIGIIGLSLRLSQ